MTEKGTFIINGTERVVVSQLIRSPGVYFSGSLDKNTGRILHSSEVRPLRGSWLEFEVGKNDVIAARIDRRRKFAATTILRAMGVQSDEQIIEFFKFLNPLVHRFWYKLTFGPFLNYLIGQAVNIFLCV